MKFIIFILLLFLGCTTYETNEVVLDINHVTHIEARQKTNPLNNVEVELCIHLLKDINSSIVDVVVNTTNGNYYKRLFITGDNLMTNFVMNVSNNYTDFILLHGNDIGTIQEAIVHYTN